MKKFILLSLFLLPLTAFLIAEETKCPEYNTCSGDACQSKSWHRKKIKKLPYTITKPGFYYLSKSLLVSSKYCGSGPLLTIESGNVIVEGFGHSIKVNKAGTSTDELTVISVPGSTDGTYTYSNIAIKNLTVTTDLTITSDTSTTNFIVGAQISGTQTLELDNVNFINVTTGLRLNNDDNVIVTSSLYEDNSANVNDYPAGRSIDLLTGITNANIQNSTFKQNNPNENIKVSGGIRALADNPVLPLKNISVRNSKFEGHDAAISFHTGNSIIVENNEIYQNNVTLHAIEMGYTVPGDAVHSVIIKNNTITALNNPSQNGYFGIILGQGSDALIESVTLITDSETVPPPDLELAPALLIGDSSGTGNPSIIFNDVLIDKVVIAGTNSIGILVDGSSNVTIQNSLISEANTNIQVMPGSLNIDINNNEINGPALLTGTSTGISFQGTSQSTIYNNTISGNLTVGVTVDSASSNNLIQNNRLINNGSPQIVNNSGSTVLSNNTTVP